MPLRTSQIQAGYRCVLVSINEKVLSILEACFYRLPHQNICWVRINAPVRPQGVSPATETDLGTAKPKRGPNRQGRIFLQIWGPKCLDFGPKRSGPKRQGPKCPGILLYSPRAPHWHYNCQVPHTSGGAVNACLDI